MEGTDRVCLVYVVREDKAASAYYDTSNGSVNRAHSFEYDKSHKKHASDTENG